MLEIAELVVDKLSKEDSKKLISYILDTTQNNVDGDSIAELITFENCNDVARRLCLDSDEIAKGLMEELKYWYRGDK